MAASAYHDMSKGTENRIFRHNRIYVLTKQQNYNIFVQTLYSCLRYTARLFDAIFVVRWSAILLELHENSRRKDFVTEKVHRRSLCEGCTPSWLDALLCHFFSLFCLLRSLPFVYSNFTQDKKTLLQKMVGEGGRGWRFPAPIVSTALLTAKTVKI